MPYKNPKQRKEYDRIYSKQYRAEHPEIREKYVAEHESAIRDYQIEYRKSHKDKHRSYMKNYYAMNGDKMREDQKAKSQTLRERRKESGLCALCGKQKPRESLTTCLSCNERYKEKRRLCTWRKRLKDVYNITEAEYFEIKKQQEDKCAICKVHEKDSKGGRLVIDHQHDIGKFRGLLCDRCNLAVGLLDESVIRLYAVIEYLEAFNSTV